MAIHPFLRISLVAFLAVATVMCLATQAGAQSTEVIRSFTANVQVEDDGSIRVVEDIIYDFASAERHGIFRDIPEEYRHDADSKRVIDVSVVSVDDGASPVPYETSHEGANLRIRIGDPDVLVTGAQRYRITYVVMGALNALSDHDELFWNVTGDDWPVTIEEASAHVALPAGALQRFTCYQGTRGATERCASSLRGEIVTFSSTGRLQPGQGLTVVAALQADAVTIGPPTLVATTDDEPQEVLADSFTWDLVEVASAAVVSLIVVALLIRQWWIAGRDRWFGDKYYVSDDAPESIKPLFSHETVVVEYEPPEIPGKERRLRPAEVGLLLDERADTLDVSATIVDMAVRGFLRIEEVKKGGMLAKRDYELTKLKAAKGQHLLAYEQRLLKELFGRQQVVRLANLSTRAEVDLTRVKSQLYDEAVRRNRFFPRNPESVRRTYRLAGSLVGATGAVAFVGLGLIFHFALPALPILIGGIVLLLAAPAMPRRTALGREMYRRCLGFRLYLTTAEDDRLRFSEQINRFDEYLPYAVVFGSVKKWARAFEGIESQTKARGWYAGGDGVAFAPSNLAVDLRDFCSAVAASGAIAAGGFGASGFGSGMAGGGGGAGGGVGGGGGGSW